MKKFLALVMAMLMILAMGTVAFAESTITLTPISFSKTYKLVGDGSSPAETFTLTQTGSNVEKSEAKSAPNLKNTAGVDTTEWTVSYTATDKANANGNEKNWGICLPEYKFVGVYTYELRETVATNVGVTYNSNTYVLTVTVTNEVDNEGKLTGKLVTSCGVKVSDTSTKLETMDNTYSAGSLAVTKEVTGIYGETKKDFTVKVTFSAPKGKIVASDISYIDDGVTKTISAGSTGWTGERKAEITLKDAETVTFTNIPFGVSYVVTEDDYTGDGYNQAVYDEKASGIIGSATVSTTITNNKGGSIETGIFMDNAPYMMIMALVVLAGAAMLLKKRAYND